MSSAGVALAAEVGGAKKVAAPAVVEYVVKENSNEAWHVVADYPQGQDIEFSLVGSLPADLASRDELPYWLVVEPAAGLSYVGGSAVVQVVREDGAAEDVTAALDVSGSDDEVVAGSANIKAAISTLKSSDRLRLTYMMRLNDAATRGLANGNDSYAHLEYGGTGYATAEAAARVVPLRALPLYAHVQAILPIAAAATREATLARSVLLKTSVYTYDLEVQKIAEDTGKPLSGARFALRDADGRWYHAAEGTETDPTSDAWADDRSQATTKTTDADGMVVFEQVDSEKYELVEVVAPAGYAAVAPVDVSIATDVIDGDESVTVLGATSVRGEIVSTSAGDGKVRVRVVDALARGRSADDGRQGSSRQTGPSDPTDADVPTDAATPTGTTAPTDSTDAAIPADSADPTSSAAPISLLGTALSRTGDVTPTWALGALAIAVSLVACGVVIRSRGKSDRGRKPV